MADGTTIVAGIPIPSTSPVFLAIVALHVFVGLACAVAGVVAMLSHKGHGRHSTFGTIYFWSLVALFVSATALALVRWAQDYPLFILGALAFVAANLGRRALRHGWPWWPRLHIAGMGSSYALMLTAFYVDNGKNLPLWRELPPIVYWLGPATFGAPIIVYALLRHPVVRRFRAGDLR
jgi:uncharacterized membrane protein